MSEAQENKLPQAVVAARTWSWIWLIPLATAVLVIVLAVQGLAGRGELIEITFAHGAGLAAGETPVRYQGVDVGRVETIALTPALDGVRVTARIDPSAAPLLRANTAFWIVQPQVGLEGVSGLDTLVRGVYINVRPQSLNENENANTTTKIKRKFQGLAQPPPPTGTTAGLRIVLQVDRLGSLRTGAPVYYREVKVGQVERTTLSPKATRVDVHVHIAETYAPLVRENSRFWNASGVDLSMGWLGPKLRAESLQSILAGGIGFATPDNDDLGPPAKQGSQFTLYEEPKSSWLDWEPTIGLNLPQSAPDSTGEPVE